MAPSTDRMTILEAAQAQQKATPAQAAVIMLFMLEFILRSIIVAASFRFGNVGPILAKPSADVNGHSAQIGIKLHKRPLYRLCSLHKNRVKFANNWKFFGPATGEKGRETAAGKASLPGDEGPFSGGGRAEKRKNLSVTGGGEEQKNAIAGKMCDNVGRGDLLFLRYSVKYTADNNIEQARKHEKMRGQSEKSAPESGKIGIWSHKKWYQRAPF